MPVNWNTIKVVIFDVDGTLYHQGSLRERMILDLIPYFLFHPFEIYDLKILADFRSVREAHAGEEVDDLEHMQYAWAAQKSHVSMEEVKEVVRKWIYEKPLEFLSLIRYKGLMGFLNSLQTYRIKYVFFSDYPAKDKLKVLGIEAAGIFAATDRNINALKPNPKGLRVIVEKMGVDVKECLFIGDREERDGAMAGAVSMPYLLIHEKLTGENYFKNYFSLIYDLTSQKKGIEE